MRGERNKSDGPGRIHDLAAEHVKDRASHREDWPGASESDQREDQKIGRVAKYRFRAMKFDGRFPESVQPICAAFFFGAGA